MFLDRLQPLHFFFKFHKLFFEPRLGQQHRLRRVFASCRSAVGGIELAHVARHALLDLLQPPLQLALGEIVVAAVDRFELAAIDGHAGFRQ